MFIESKEREKNIYLSLYVAVADKKIKREIMQSFELIKQLLVGKQVCFYL